MINGRKYDWESLTVIGPSGIMFDIEGIDYSDGVEIKERYGKGSVPRGYGNGNYSGEGSLTMNLDEWDRFKVTLLPAIYEHSPFPVIISYANDDNPVVTDKLPFIKIIKVSTSNTQGSDNAGQKKIDFKMLSPIIYNGTPAKIK